MRNNFFGRITIDPRVRFGKPCIRGTRITVTDIINLLAAGFALDEIPAEYPGITKKDVLAALKFASQLTEEPAKLNKVIFGQNCA